MPGSDKLEMHRLGLTLIRNPLMVVALFATVTVAALLMPVGDWHLRREDYLPFHTLLEFVSICVAFTIFATVWHTPSKQVSTSIFWIAVALFFSGWLDFEHALSFKDMPDFITPSSSNKSISFWLTARLLTAITIAACSFFPEPHTVRPRGRQKLFWGHLLVVASVSYVILFHEDSLPVLRTEAGVTPLKIWLEVGVAVLFLVAALRFRHLSAGTDNRFLHLMFSAAALCFLSELLLTSYTESHEFRNFLGHVLKIAAYVQLYRAVLVALIQRPYQLLEEQRLDVEQKNQRLRMLSVALDSTSASIMVADRDGRLLWRNQTSRQNYQSDSTEPSLSLSLFSSPVTTNPAVAAEMRAQLRTGNRWRGLVPNQRSQDGATVTMARTVTPLLSDANEITGFVSVSENITESIKAELRHKRVLQTALEGILVVDESGQILESNDACTRILGYSTAELSYMNIADLKCEDPIAESIGELISRLKETVNVQCEGVLRRKIEGEAYVELSATHDEQLSQYYIFIRDITGRRRAEQAQRDLERQLQQSQKVQAIGQLTSGIAHDFNNILASIIGYATLAHNRLVPDKEGKLAKYLREVIASSERARNLVARMMAFTHSRNSDTAVVLKPSKVVNEVLSMMRASIPSSIELAEDIEDDSAIFINPGELSQLLMNLMINARDAIETNATTIGLGKIVICTHLAKIDGEICAITHERLYGTYLAIDVSDNGAGIPEEIISRIFDPFFTTKEVGKGTGLGLSMAQGIVIRAEGHILVSSVPGTGTTFQLLFPIVDEGFRGSELHPDSLQPPLGSGQTVWIVDDEVAITEVTGDLLEGNGYAVQRFSAPADLLRALLSSECAVDLVITDQTMPGLTGVELARAIRKHCGDIPVILCTGQQADIDPALLSDTAVCHVIRKPFELSVMLQIVADVLDEDRNFLGKSELAARRNAAV